MSLTAACSRQADGPTIVLDHLGTSAPLPVSGNDELAVADLGFVCLFDGYEKQLACGDLPWNDTFRFGRRGQGPGELGDYGILTRTAGGGVGFTDYQNNRISVFTRQGYTGQLPRPSLIIPASDMSPDGTYAAYASLPTQRAGEVALLEVRAEDGEALREVRLRLDSATVGGGAVIVAGATRLRGGDFIVRIAVDSVQRLLYFAADGRYVGDVRMPEFPPRLPDAREIEIFREQLALFPNDPAVDRAVRSFAERPLGPLPRNSLFRLIQQEPEGRILILTSRRSPHGTYVEAYAGVDNVGRALLNGRVLAIQIVDSLLVALTEEMPSQDLIPKRRLEWYRVGSGSGGRP